MAPDLDWSDRNIGSNLHKETQSNVELGWVTMISVSPRCSTWSPTRWGEGRYQMALNESGGDFLFRWYCQKRGVSRRLQCPRCLLICLELLLLLKLPTIEYDCYLARNSLGKLACKYRVFWFPIIPWAVQSCSPAVPFFLVVDAGDYVHHATLFLTWTLP